MEWPGKKPNVKQINGERPADPVRLNSGRGLRAIRGIPFRSQP